MSAFHLFEKLAWAVSAIIAAWLLLDLILTKSRYGEAVLMSSREGEIEDEMVVERAIDVKDEGMP